MNVQPMKLELSGEELTVLVAHLKRHLDQVDKELVRTDNPRLQHAIAREVRVLEGVVARLEGSA
jgi:hypothetical protein